MHLKIQKNVVLVKLQWKASPVYLFVVCRRSNDKEKRQAATRRRHKSEQSRTTKKEQEQSGTIKNNLEQKELNKTNWAQAQDQKLLGNKSLSFKILCSSNFVHFLTERSCFFVPASYLESFQESLLFLSAFLKFFSKP